MIFVGCVIAALALWVIYLSVTVLTLAEHVQLLAEAHEQREHQHWKAYWGAYKKTPYEDLAMQPEDYAPPSHRVRLIHPPGGETYVVNPDVPF